MTREELIDKLDKAEVGSIVARFDPRLLEEHPTCGWFTKQKDGTLRGWGEDSGRFPREIPDLAGYGVYLIPAAALAQYAMTVEAQK